MSRLDSPEPGRRRADYDAAGADDAEYDDAEYDDVGTDDTAEDSEQLSPVTLPRQASLRIASRWTALVALIGMAEGAVIIAYALLIRAAIDGLIRNPASAAQMLNVAVGLVAVALGGALLRSLEFSVSESVGYRYVARLRMVMYRHLLRTPPRLMLAQSKGGVLLRFMGDLTTIRTWVSRGLARALAATCILLAGLGVIAYFDPAMTLAAVGVLLVGAGVSLSEGRNVRRVTRNARRQRSNLATNLSDQIGGLSVVQAMGHSRGEYDRFGRQNERLTRHLLRYAGLRAVLRAVAGASASLAVVAVLVVGALDVASGATTVGGVVAAMVVVRQLVRPVRTLGLSHEYWQAARVSREKIAAFLRRPYREADGSELAHLRVGPGRIEFRDVHLDGSLRGVTAEVAPGRVVAVIGPNGVGKSSLLSVVARLADPDSGEVAIDGQVLTACTLRSCAARISIMGPQLPLMRGTLRRNLTYRWPAAPQSEVDRVIRLCRLGEVIARLPDGLDAPIKEGGANLSSGEAARIALARALLGNPKVLLLDEPTASLDPATRAVVHEVIARYGGTVIVATHDLQEAALADEVWRMDGGRIVQTLPGAAFRESLDASPVLPGWARAADRA